MEKNIMFEKLNNIFGKYNTNDEKENIKSFLSKSFVTNSYIGIQREDLEEFINSYFPTQMQFTINSKVYIYNTSVSYEPNIDNFDKLEKYLIESIEKYEKLKPFT